MLLHDVKTFEELSSHFNTWVIKYCSPSYDKPLFLVWYTDSDEKETDKLLTFKTGDIFATSALHELKKLGTANQSDLVYSGNLEPWLGQFGDLEPVENCTYDIISVAQSIGNNILDLPTIEGIAEFINLYVDFVSQDAANASLKIHSDDERIQAVWTYYYDYIFWPRFNDREKFEAWDRPPLQIDCMILLEKVGAMTRAFEGRIKLVP